MSTSIFQTKDVKLACYQGMSDYQSNWSALEGTTKSLKENYAVQIISVPRVAKDPQKIECTCRFCREKVELSIRSTPLQKLVWLGLIVAFALAASLIYFAFRSGSLFLVCLTVGICLFAIAAIGQGIEEVSISGAGTSKTGKPKHKILQ